MQPVSLTWRAAKVVEDARDLPHCLVRPQAVKVHPQAIAEALLPARAQGGGGSQRERGPLVATLGSVPWESAEPTRWRS